jgi:hypothetical protein
MSLKRNTSTAKGIASDVENEIKKLLQPTRQLGGLLGTLDNILSTMNGIVSPFSEVQKSAIELAKAVGLSSKSIMAIATRTIEQNHKMQLSTAYNMSSEEMIRMQTSLMKGLERNVAIDQVGSVLKNGNGEIVNPNFDSELENLIAASKVFDEDSIAEIVAGFDKVGKSMGSAAKATGKLFKEAGEYGINLTKYAENFTNNLQMVQTFNFRNGINGLREMARKATEIRQDMKQIASFADKVGSVTGAVETAANLQVLGGSFASMSNPLAMLNESLTNMEGLQDRFIKMSNGAARYNSVTHEIEMDPVTRQLMKRAAESMGVDANNFIDQAYAQARRGEILSQMNGFGGFSAEIQKLLPNVGEIDEFGRAGATIGGDFKTLGEIAAMPGLQQQLIDESRSESDDIKVIAKSVMGIEDIISGREKKISNAAARNLIRPGAIGGMTSYDMVMDFITKKFDPSVIEAAEKVDLFGKSVSIALNTLLNTAQVTGIRTLNYLDDPEKFEEAVKGAFTELFGKGEAANNAGKVVGKIAGQLATFTNNVNNRLKESGINLLPGYENEVEVERAATIEATTGTGYYVTARHTDNTPVAAASNTVEKTEPELINGLTNGYNMLWNGPANPMFQVNAVTMQAKEVTPTTQEATTNTSNKGRRNQKQEPYKFDLSGTLTMNINGDNGRIGTVDILNWLKTDGGFRREMAKALAETMAEMESGGQIANK